MFDFASYQSRTLHLELGDILVVYSDGLTEAENPDGDMWGTRNLLEVIREQGPSGSHAVEQAVLGALDAFTQLTPQTDDITFVVVEKCR
jgi:sigma-B regulation protein RsbU (phosphoserine phosphatase)